MYAVIGKTTKHLISKMNKNQVMNAMEAIEAHLKSFKITDEERVYWRDLKELYSERLHYLKMEYADLLKKIRQLKNLTQHQLAKELGTNQKTLSFWENAQNIPNLIYQEKIKKFFSSVS